MINPRHLPPLLLALTLLACHGTAPRPALAPDTTLTTIAFGACADQNRPQPVWRTILTARPDLFLMLGDNVYSEAQDLGGLRAEYAQLAAEPGFARLRTTTPILATWDDHDYGVNDGGAENPYKEIFKQGFLDFFEVPSRSPRRQRPGLHDAQTFGPPGRRVQVILLDTRFFRSPLVRRPEGESSEHGRYLPSDDPTKTMLGEEQWRWLESELARPAELRLLVSSVQLIPDEHGWEKWGNLPHERRRLFELVRKTGARGVVVLSGDRHQGEISELPPSDPDGVGYPLYEVTTGGLTHGSRLERENNRYRIAGPEIFGEPNFGVIRIDWQPADPRVRLEIRDVGGRVALEHGFALSELAPVG